MGSRVRDFLTNTLERVGIRSRRTASTEAGLPVLMEEETSNGSIVMVFTAIAGVVMYAFEPAATSVLFSATFGLAVYTTRRPETMAWDMYHTAMTQGLDERITMLEGASQLSPQNDQIAFALGWSLAQSGRYAESVDVLRALEERRPDHAAVASALAMASRMLLAQATSQRPVRH